MKNKIEELLEGLKSMGEDAEFIPVIGKEEEESMMNAEIPETIQILPVRNNVLFPGTVMPVTLSRSRSIRVIKDAFRKKMPIGVFTQKEAGKDEPGEKDIYKVGTMGRVIKVLTMPDGSIAAIIQGTRRIVREQLIADGAFLTALVHPYDDDDDVPASTLKIKALLGTVKELYTRVVNLSSKLPKETLFAVQNIESPSFFLYFIAASMEVDAHDKQKVLEKKNMEARALTILEYLNNTKLLLELKQKIENKVETDISKQQKEYFLNQQLKVIQEELGSSSEQEILELKERGEKKKWNAEVKAHFEKEIRKLQRINSMSPDYSVELNYINVLLDLPWNEYTTDKYDLEKARKVLDKDHFGLEKVKERILSYLAVLQLRGDMKAPILCLVGPPGVGKTSLGKSIAKAMGRSYVRMSLGGLHDESEIRGHRKTYIGAMPGRIIQGIKKAKSSNPVFILDEIDKISGMTNNGDPSAALLELLDPEQNNAFHDNFVEVDYDLSHVLFIATANSLSSIHPALLDRMEVIEVSSYVMDEKVEIARQHLIPKQVKEHGMKSKDISFTEDMIRYIIGEYTRESGVRQLEKTLAGIIRERAKRMVAGKEEDRKKGVKISRSFVKEALGVPVFTEPEILKEDMVGVVTGLAWTRVGGDVLFIEAALSSGKGELSMTGNLGDVMKESATLALAYIRSHADELGVSVEKLDNSRIHLHVPEGATPKDGPSAGLAIFSAMMSILTGKKVNHKVAMTGEITLRGQVLPIGGVREKLLAAKRAGIERVVFCKENQPQVEEIPEEYRQGLSISYMEKVPEIQRWIF